MRDGEKSKQTNRGKKKEVGRMRHAIGITRLLGVLTDFALVDFESDK